MSNEFDPTKYNFKNPHEVYRAALDFGISEDSLKKYAPSMIPSEGDSLPTQLADSGLNTLGTIVRASGEGVRAINTGLSHVGKSVDEFVTGDSDPVEEYRVDSIDSSADMVTRSGQALTDLMDSKQEHSLNSLKDTYKHGSAWELLSEGTGAIAEGGTNSAPFMAGMMVAPFQTYAGLTQEMAEDRAKNDGRDPTSPSAEDYAIAAPVAGVFALLERWGASSVLKPFRDAPIKASKFAAVNEVGEITGTSMRQGSKEIGKQAGIGAIREGETEFVQTLLQDFATQKGTEKGYNFYDSLENGAYSAFVGAGVGSSLRGASTTGQYANARGQLEKLQGEQFDDLVNAENTAEQTEQDYKKLNSGDIDLLDMAEPKTIEQALDDYTSGVALQENAAALSMLGDAMNINPDAASKMVEVYAAKPNSVMFTGLLEGLESINNGGTKQEELAIMEQNAPEFFKQLEVQDQAAQQGQFDEYNQQAAELRKPHEKEQMWQDNAQPEVDQATLEHEQEQAWAANEQLQHNQAMADDFNQQFEQNQVTEQQPEVEAPKRTIHDLRAEVATKGKKKKRLKKLVQKGVIPPKAEREAREAAESEPTKPLNEQQDYVPNNILGEQLKAKTKEQAAVKKAEQEVLNAPISEQEKIDAWQEQNKASGKITPYKDVPSEKLESLVKQTRLKAHKKGKNPPSVFSAKSAKPLNEDAETGEVIARIEDVAFEIMDKANGKLTGLKGVLLKQGIKSPTEYIKGFYGRNFREHVLYLESDWQENNDKLAKQAQQRIDKIERDIPVNRKQAYDAVNQIEKDLQQVIYGNANSVNQWQSNTVKNLDIVKRFGEQDNNAELINVKDNNVLADKSRDKTLAALKEQLKPKQKEKQSTKTVDKPVDKKAKPDPQKRIVEIVNTLGNMTTKAADVKKLEAEYHQLVKDGADPLPPKIAVKVGLSKNETERKQAVKDISIGVAEKQAKAREALNNKGKSKEQINKERLSFLYDEIHKLIVERQNTSIGSNRDTTLLNKFKKLSHEQVLLEGKLNPETTKKALADVAKADIDPNKPTLILACSKTKTADNASAYDMYAQGDVMKVVNNFGKDVILENFNVLFISARFGLISWDKNIDTYDTVLKAQRAAEMTQVTHYDVVAKALMERINTDNDVYVGLPKDYRELLTNLTGYTGDLGFSKNVRGNGDQKAEIKQYIESKLENTKPVEKPNTKEISDNTKQPVAFNSREELRNYKELAVTVIDSVRDYVASKDKEVSERQAKIDKEKKGSANRNQLEAEQLEHGMIDVVIGGSKYRILATDKSLNNLAKKIRNLKAKEKPKVPKPTKLAARGGFVPDQHLSDENPSKPKMVQDFLDDGEMNNAYYIAQDSGVGLIYFKGKEKGKEVVRPHVPVGKPFTYKGITFVPVKVDGGYQAMSVNSGMTAGKPVSKVADVESATKKVMDGVSKEQLERVVKGDKDVQAENEAQFKKENNILDLDDGSTMLERVSAVDYISQEQKDNWENYTYKEQQSIVYNTQIINEEYKAAIKEQEQQDKLLGRRKFLKMATASVGVAIGGYKGIDYLTTDQNVKLGKAQAVTEQATRTALPKAAEQAARDGKNLKEVLKAALPDAPKVLKPLINKLILLAPNNIKVKVDDKSMVNANGSLTIKDSDNILTLYNADVTPYNKDIGQLQGLTYGTLLHETLHGVVLARYRSLSSGMIKSNYKKVNMPLPKTMSELDQFHAVWREFKSDFYRSHSVNELNKLKKEAWVSEALNDPDEFFVRALTDARLQNYLSQREYKGRTLMQRFTDWVKRVLFKKQGTAPSWLDAALMTSNDLLVAMGKEAPDYRVQKAFNRYNNRSAEKAHERVVPEEQEGETLATGARKLIVKGIVNPMQKMFSTQLGLKARATDQIVRAKHKLFEMYGKSPLKSFEDWMIKMQAERTDIMASAEKNIDKAWDLLSKKHSTLMSRLMLDSTMERLDPSVAFEDNPIIKSLEQQISKADSKLGHDDVVESLHQKLDYYREIHTELEERFNALPKKAKDLFEDTRDFYKELWEKQNLALISRLNDMEMDGKTKQAAITSIEKMFHKAINQGVYFPLARFGDHVAIVRDPETDRIIERHQFENKDDALAKKEKLAVQYPNHTVFYDKLTQGSSKDTDIESYSKDLLANIKVMAGKLDKKRQDKFDKETEQAEDAQIAALAQEKLKLYDDVDWDSLSKQEQAELTKKRKALADKNMNVRLTGGDIPSMAELEKMLGLVPDKAVMDLIYQTMIRALPHQSATKRLAKRSYTKGATDDMRRAFAHTTFHAATRITKIKYAHKITNSLNEMNEVVSDDNYPQKDKEEARVVLQHMRDVHAANMNPTTTKATSLLITGAFLYHLAASPAAGMVNMSQTYLIGVPKLGQDYGNTKAMQTIGKFSAMFGKQAWRTKGGFKLNKVSQFEGWVSLKDNKDVPENMRKLLEALHNDGTIEITQTAAMAQTADTDMREQAITSRNKIKILRGMGSIFHNAELFNREVIALSAMQLFTEKYQKENNGESPSPETVKRVAREAVNVIHFNYSGENRALGMRGNAAKLAFVFKTYSQNVINLMLTDLAIAFDGATPEERRQHAKAFLTMMSAHVATGGVLALPMIGVFSGIANMVLNLVGDDENDILNEFRTDLHKISPVLAETVFRGVANLTGADISTRITLNGLLWRDPDYELNQMQTIAHYTEQTFGAVYGTFIKMIRGTWTAIDGFRQGDSHKIVKGVATAAPKFANAPLKAVYRAIEGEKNINGDVLMSSDEFLGKNVMRSVLQAAGFSPSKLTNTYGKNQANTTLNQRIRAKRKLLMTKMYKLIESQGVTTDLWSTIAEFNQKHPEHVITPQQITSGFKAKVLRKHNTKDGLYIPNTKRKTLTTFDY